jgi:hypothetical protein
LWERGSEGNAYVGQYFVKFPDNTDFYLDPSYKIVALHADPAFVSGGRPNGAGGLDFLPGETVHFGVHGQSNVSCTLWVRLKESNAEFPPAPWEVRAFSVDASGNLNVSVSNTETGENMIPQVVKGNEGDEYYGQYFVKFQDDTRFYLDPSYKIVALHSDPYFATGGRIKEGTNILEFYPGETAYFGTQGQSVYSCTVWVALNTPPLPAGLPAVINVQAVSASGVNSVPRGGTLRFQAAVTVNGEADNTVRWSVSNNSSASTTIDRDGLLKVGDNENSGSLKVMAKSTFDATKSSTVSVAVDSTGNPVAPEEPNTDGNIPNDNPSTDDGNPVTPGEPNAGGGGGGCEMTGTGLSAVIMLLCGVFIRKKRG